MNTDPLTLGLARLRRAANSVYPWSIPPTEAGALIEEIERLRAVEADAERARVKADLWSYYEALVQANGAEGITQLVVQRDDARAEVERLRAEADEMRRWAEEAAHAENLNAQDAQKERAAVVSMLRAEARAVGASPDERRVLHAVARSIERGEHRREEKP